MYPQSSAALTSFACNIESSNKHNLVHTEMTLAQKLGVIKRCLEEKQFSNHYSSAHDFKNKLNNRCKPPIKSCLVKELDFGVSTIVKKISTVILNKKMLALSSIELNSLIKLTSKSKKNTKKYNCYSSLDKSTHTFHDPELVGFISVFSDSKVRDSIMTFGYDRTKHHKRKTYRSFSRYGYINSLALYVEH